MNKFGVCNYDFDAYEPKVENLEKFDTYEEAFERYMQRLMENEHYPYYIDKTLWYVWIEGDKRIVQFQRLNEKTKCKIIEVDE